MSIPLLVMAGLTVAAQQPPEPLPRFRSGANLVHVDAYVSKDGTAITDLGPNELEVFEDDKPQKIESVELITAGPAGPQSARRDPTTVGDMREMAGDPSARLGTGDTGLSGEGVMPRLRSISSRERLPELSHPGARMAA